MDKLKEGPPGGGPSLFALSVLAALGHLSQRERQGTGDADSRASDIGHWLGMTEKKQGAGAVGVCLGGQSRPALRRNT